ncbi:unnamed protein product [Musa textilis]
MHQHGEWLLHFSQSLQSRFPDPLKGKMEDFTVPLMMR